MKKELRPGHYVEVRSDAGRPVKLIGYAAKYGSISQDLGGFREVLEKGCFRDALAAGDDVRALVDHDPRLIVGRRSAGTLRIEEDDTGLRVEITPPRTTIGQDLIENVKARNLTNMSFAFTARDPGPDVVWDRSSTPPLRRIRSVQKIWDVSIVAYPAFTSTSIGVDSRQQKSADRLARLMQAERELDGYRYPAIDEVLRASDPAAWRAARLQRAEADLEAYKRDRRHALTKAVDRYGVAMSRPGDPHLAHSVGPMKLVKRVLRDERGKITGIEERQAREAGDEAPFMVEGILTHLRTVAVAVPADKSAIVSFTVDETTSDLDPEERDKLRTLIPEYLRRHLPSDLTGPIQEIRLTFGPVPTKPARAQSRAERLAAAERQIAAERQARLDRIERELAGALR